MHSNSWDFLAAFLGQLSTLILCWSVFLGPGGCLAAHMPGSSDSPCCRQQQKLFSKFRCLSNCTSTGSKGELCKWSTGHRVTKAILKWFQNKFRPFAAPEGWNKSHSINVSWFIYYSCYAESLLPSRDSICAYCRMTEKYQKFFIQSFLSC